MSFKSWKFWVGIIISVVFLYLFLKDIDWDSLWKVLRSISLFWVFLSGFLNLITFVIRAYRWKFFFKRENRAPFSSLFSATSIGFMANTVLPLRIGEIVRAVMLGQKENIPKTTCFATLVVERLFDLLSILFFFALFITFSGLPEGVNGAEKDFMTGINIAGYTAGVMSFCVILVVIFLRFQTELTLRIIGWFLKPFSAGLRESILEFVASFINGLDILKDFGALVSTTLLSLLIWLITITQSYVLFFGFGMELQFSHATILLVVIALSVMVPAAPGFVGTFHYACSVTLTLMAIEPTIAKGYAIVAHVMSMLPITIVGFLFMWWENISILELQKKDGQSSGPEKSE